MQASEIPVEQGGLGLPDRMRARVAEVLGATDFAFAFAFINQHNVALRIAEHGSDAARKRYLPGLLAGDLIGGTAMSEPRAAAISPPSPRVRGDATGEAGSWTARRPGWPTPPAANWRWCSRKRSRPAGPQALPASSSTCARRSASASRAASRWKGWARRGIGGFRQTGYPAEAVMSSMRPDRVSPWRWPVSTRRARISRRWPRGCWTARCGRRCATPPPGRPSAVPSSSSRGCVGRWRTWRCGCRSCGC